MCDGCTDPIVAVETAERALRGLSILVAELPPDADIPARSIGPLIDLIRDRLDPAVDALQGYERRDRM